MWRVTLNPETGPCWKKNCCSQRCQMLTRIRVVLENTKTSAKEQKAWTFWSKLSLPSSFPGKTVILFHECWEGTRLSGLRIAELCLVGCPGGDSHCSHISFLIHFTGGPFTDIISAWYYSTRIKYKPLFWLHCFVQPNIFWKGIKAPLFGRT